MLGASTERLIGVEFIVTSYSFSFTKIALEPSTLYSIDILMGRTDPCCPKRTNFRFSFRTTPTGMVPKERRFLSVPADKSVPTLGELFGYSITKSTKSREELFLLVIP